MVGSGVKPGWGASISGVSTFDADFFHRIFWDAFSERLARFLGIQKDQAEKNIKNPHAVSESLIF